MAVTVSVTLTDEEYKDVLVKSKAKGLSVAQFYHLIKRETQELIKIKPAGKTSSNVQLYVKEE